MEQGNSSRRGVVQSHQVKEHDFEYTALVKGKERPNNTSDKSVVMKDSRSGDVKILLSVEHGLTRRRDVNDAIRLAVENDIDADMAGRK